MQNIDRVDVCQKGTKIFLNCLFIYLFILFIPFLGGCIGSSLLRVGFLKLR